MSDDAETDAQKVPDQVRDRPRRRRPARENPWYVLMTIAGEQGSFVDDHRHDANLRYWHGWLAASPDPSVAEKLHAVLGQDRADELAPFSAAEQAFWDRAVAARITGDVPDQDLPVDLDGVRHDGVLNCADVVFPFGCRAIGARFGALRFNRARVMGDLSLDGLATGSLDLKAAVVRGDLTLRRSAVAGDVWARDVQVAGESLDMGGACVTGDVVLAGMRSRVALFGGARIGGNLVLNDGRAGLVELGRARINVDLWANDLSIEGDLEAVGLAVGAQTCLDGLHLGGAARCRQGRFGGAVSFRGATVGATASFRRARFGDGADFSDTTFARATDFSESRFAAAVPQFYGAALHEDTDWHRVAWPPRPCERRTVRAAEIADGQPEKDL